MSRKQLPFLVLLSSVCLIALGCGGAHRLPLAEVEGVVTLDGQPLEGARLMFTPESGRSAKGVAGADGTFTLTTYRDGDGAVVGKHAIVVFPPGAGGSGRPIDVDQPRPASRLPVSYGDAATSGLTFEVKAEGTNQPKLDLSSDAPPGRRVVGR